MSAHDPKNTGGPAFPCLPPLGPEGTSAVGYPYVAEGISMRDYFAAKAMTAMIHEYFRCNGPCFGSDHLYRGLPAHAYTMADAMIKARII